MRYVAILLFSSLVACTGVVADEDLEGRERQSAVGADFPAPRGSTIRHEIAGQVVWIHGAPAGAFHTYDALRSCGDRAPRKVHVLLPANYGTVRHPVIYMNDGDTAFWPGGAAGKSWRVADTLARIGEGVGSPIVVAVVPNEREREYTHAPWLPTRAWGGLPAYARELADCIKPFVDRNYRTDPSRERTAIVGSSHGGLAAFWIGTRHPDRFGFVGALSSSFWAGLDTIPLRSSRTLASSSLVADVAPLLGDRARRPRIWIDWGLRRDGQFHNDFVEAAATDRGREMSGVLRERGYVETRDLFVHVDPIGGHDEDAWAHRFELLVRAFAR
jgi:pimeloyl-ACP methyl ester carboxylesterase